MPINTSPSIPPHIKNVGNQLWLLASNCSLDDYKSPWDSLGRELMDSLLAELKNNKSLKAVNAAPQNNYAACTKALIRSCAPVHRILTDIRGLAMAADVDLTAPVKPAPIVLHQFGEELIYERAPWF